MDKKLEIRFPPLKRTVKLLTELKLNSSENPSQFLERVGREMRTGGIGEEPNINLNWERLLIVLVVKGLPNHLQIELLKKFDTLDCTLDNLSRFLDTLSQAKSVGGEINAIRKKISPKKKPTSDSSSSISSSSKRCTVCNSQKPRHIEDVKNNSGVCTNQPCTFCKKFFHSASNCWSNPASPSFKGPGTVNQVSDSQISDSVPTSMNLSPPDTPAITYEGIIQCLSANTPRINVNISQQSKHLGRTSLLADSGSTVDIVSLAFARGKNLNLIKVNPANFSLTAANGGSLSVNFTTDVDICLPGTENNQRVRLLVSPDLHSDDIIIGWSRMLRWNLLQLTDFSSLPQSLSSLQL